MGYIYDDWKKLLEDFQKCVEKDLEEIHKQKAEVQQIKEEIEHVFDDTEFNDILLEGYTFPTIKKGDHRYYYCQTSNILFLLHF